MKAIEQYFPVVLFIVLYKVVLVIEIIEAVNASLKCAKCGESTKLLFVLSSNFLHPASFKVAARRIKQFQLGDLKGKQGTVNSLGLKRHSF